MRTKKDVVTLLKKPTIEKPLMNVAKTKVKGISDSEYASVHSWIKKHKGKASYCENDSNHPSYRYEWANLSGKYLRDLNDFKSLCLSCHRKLDYAEEQRIKSSIANKGKSYNHQPVVGVDRKKGITYYFLSTRKAAQFFKVVDSSVTNCLTKRSKSSAGLTWFYKKDFVS